MKLQLTTFPMPKPKKKQTCVEQGGASGKHPVSPQPQQSQAPINHAFHRQPRIAGRGPDSCESLRPPTDSPRISSHLLRARHLPRNPRATTPACNRKPPSGRLLGWQPGFEADEATPVRSAGYRRPVTHDPLSGRIRNDLGKSRPLVPIDEIR